MRITISILSFILLATAATAATIELPAEAPATREVALEEMWRIGGEDEEDILMGIIFDGKMDADGNTYLIDRQLSQVLVIGPDGELVTTLGREGEGPGELRNPHGLFLMGEGKVGVIQGFPGRVTVINADDTPGGTIDIGGPKEEGGFAFLRSLRLCGDRFVGVYGKATFDLEKGKTVRTNTMAIMDMDGTSLVEIGSHTLENDLQKQVFDEVAMFAEFDTWAARDNRLFTVPVQDAYTIRARDLEGNILTEFTRPFTARTRTDEDKEELAGDGVSFRVTGMEIEVENKALDEDPPIDDLQVGSAGRLFVRTCWDVRELLPAGTADRFDVISPEGDLLEQVAFLVPEFDNENDRMVFLDGSHFLLIRNFDSAEAAMFAAFGEDEGEEEEDFGDAEPLEVVLYRMP